MAKDIYGELIGIVSKYISSSDAEEIMESLCSRVMVYPEDIRATDIPTLLLGFCTNDDILDYFTPGLFADMMDALLAYTAPKYQEGIGAPWELIGEGAEDKDVEKKVWEFYDAQKDQSSILIQSIRHLVDEIVKSRTIEDRLKDSEHKFYKMLEISPETKLIHIKGKIVYSNPAGMELFGAGSSEDLLGKSVMELIQTDYQETHADLRSHQDDKGSSESIRERIIRMDGRYLDVEVTASPIAFEGQSAVELTIKDITDRVRAGRAIKESEARYRLLAENIADVIWTMDMNLNFTYISPSVMALRGFTVEEAVNQSLDQVLTPKSYERAVKFFTEEIERYIATGKDDKDVRTLELEQYCKDGTTVLSELRITGIWDEMGEPVGILGVTRDISGRKKAEKKLQASEGRFRRLFNSMVEGVYRTTKDGKLLSANPALMKMLGYKTFNQLKKLNVEKDLYLDPKNRKKFTKQLEKTGELRNLELRLKRKDGSEIVALENAHVIKDDRGKVMYYEGTLTDITDRILAKAEIKESTDQFKRLFENMIEGLFQTTPDGKILTANPAMVKMLGYRSEKEMMKLDITNDLYADPGQRKLFIRRLGKEDELTNYEIKMMRKDGSEITVRENVRTVRDDKGKVLFYEGTMEDVSTEIMAEDALKASEEKFRSMVESLAEGVVIVDGDENFLFANPAGERVFGVPRKKLTKMNIKDFVNKKTYKKIREQTSKRKKGRAGSYEVEFTRPGGERRKVIVHTAPQFDSDGNFIATIGILTDITERAKMEAKMKVSEERYRELVERADIAIVIDDRDGKYIYYNNKFLRMYGFKDADMKKVNVIDLVHPDDRKRVWKYHNDRLKNRKPPERYRFKAIKKNGEAFYVEVDAVERLVDGKVNGTRAYLWDISEQVEMELNLRSSEERYKDLVEKAGIAIIQDDAQGNITYYNQKFLELYGYSEKEMKKLKRKNLVHPDDYKMVMGHHLGRVKGKRSPIRYRFRGRRKTGETIRIEVDVSPIQLEGKIAGTRAYLKDITELWEMEEAVKQSEEMFRDLVEKAGIAIVIDSNEGVFKYFNQRFLDVFGYTDKEIRQLTIRDLVHPDDTKKVMQRHKERTLGKDSPSRYRFRGVRKNGKTIYLEVEAVVIIEKGKPAGTRSYIWDITKRLKVEESIKRHKAMIEGMRTVEDALKKVDRSGGTKARRPPGKKPPKKGGKKRSGKKK